MIILPSPTPLSLIGTTHLPLPCTFHYHIFYEFCYLPLLLSSRLRMVILKEQVEAVNLITTALHIHKESMLDTWLTHTHTHTLTSHTICRWESETPIAMFLFTFSRWSCCTQWLQLGVCLTVRSITNSPWASAMELSRNNQLAEVCHKLSMSIRHGFLKKHVLVPPNYQSWCVDLMPGSLLLCLVRDHEKMQRM